MGEVSVSVDHFEDQFLPDSHEPLGIPFDEETNFFHPEEVQDEEFPAAQQVEESIYTNHPLRVYLREMVCVPLLPPEAQVNLPRRIDLCTLRTQTTTSLPHLLLFP